MSCVTLAASIGALTLRVQASPNAGEGCDAGGSPPHNGVAAVANDSNSPSTTPAVSCSYVPSASSPAATTAVSSPGDPLTSKDGGVPGAVAGDTITVNISDGCAPTTPPQCGALGAVGIGNS